MTDLPPPSPLPSPDPYGEDLSSLVADPSQVTATTPVYTSYLSNLRALSAKYASPSAEMAAQIPNTPTSILDTLRAMDTRRVLNGGQPYSGPESAKGLWAATNNEPATPEPDTSFFDRLTDDAKALLTSVPKIPELLHREAGDFASFVNNPSSTPINSPFDIAHVPGVRMLPGSFIAGQFGTGGHGVAGLGEHPLFTALDVLPFGEFAAEKSGVVKAAREAALLNADHLGYIDRVKPIQTFVRNYRPGVAADKLLTPGAINPRTHFADPELVGLTPNPVGRAINAVGDRLAGTRVGQTGLAAFGEATRQAQQVAVAETAKHLTNDVMNELRGVDSGNPMAKSIARVDELNKTVDLSPAERSDLYRSAVSAPDRTTFLDSITDPAHRDYASSLLDVSDQILAEKVNRGLLKPVEYTDAAGATHVEYHTPDAATRIETARYRSAVSADRNLRRTLVQHPELLDPASHDAIANHLVSETIDMLSGRAPTFTSRSDILLGVRSNVALLDRLGYNTDALHRFTMSQNINTLDKMQNAGVDLYREYEVGPPGSGNIQTTPRDPAVPVPPDVDKLINKRLTAVDVEMKRANWSNRAEQMMARRLTQVEARAVPGRFANQVHDLTARSFIDDMHNNAGRLLKSKTVDLNTFTPEMKAQVADIIQRGELHALESVAPGLRDIYANYFADARRAWQDLYAQGIDPLHVHTVSPHSARAMTNPDVLTSLRDVTSTVQKGRNIERIAGVEDLAVSVTHDAYEIMFNDAKAAVIDQFANNFTVSGSDLAAQFASQARAIADASGKPYMDVLSELVGRRYVKFTPGRYGVRSEMSAAYADKDLYIAREIDAALSYKEGPIGRLMSVPMRAFRTAILPLSPRWHVNNIISGVILSGATLGPSSLKFVRRAWEMAREEGGVSHIPGAPAGGEYWGREALAALKQPLSERLAVAQSFYAGRSLGKALDSVAGALGDRGVSWIGKVVDKASGAVTASYNLNLMFDDFFRSLSYLYGEDKALTRGMTREQAVMAGVEQTRKVLQNWDRITPIERGVIRNIFPFYSWASHVIRFMSHYPADHPWRLAISARLADIEWNDHLSSVPKNLRDLLFVGDVKDGMVTGINVGAWNPFRDQANYPALIGFLTGQKGGNLDAVSGQLNPFIGATLKTLGIDPAFGPDLYPQLEYDPTTGGLRVASKSFPMEVLTDTIPQLNTIADLAGWNEDFKTLLTTNPDAAQRQMQSSLGLPILSKTYNIDEQQIKNEILRFRQMQQDRAAALKSGDTAALRAWPSLRATADYVDSLTPEQRAALTPNRAIPGVTDLWSSAIPTRTNNTTRPQRAP